MPITTIISGTIKDTVWSKVKDLFVFVATSDETSKIAQHTWQCYETLTEDDAFLYKVDVGLMLLL